MASFRELFSRARLEYKILLVLVLGLTVGFGSYVIYTVQAESSALLEQHRQKSRLFAESLKSGIRNMMLSGRPSYVRSLIEEAREEFRGIGRLKVFNNESMEIFSERSQFVSVVAHDSSITLFMTGGVKPAGDSRHYELLENETTCQQCHGTDHAVRGLLQTEFSDRSRDPVQMAGHIATRAFESVMLSGKGDTADELMRGIDSLNDGVRAQVYDRDGYYVAFGDDREEVPDTILAQAARTFAENVPSAPLVFDSLRHRILVFGLKNNTECQVCHGSDHAVRGMLALWVRKGGKTAKKLPEQVAVLGFKNLMLVQRGMYASQYASTVRRLPFVKTFKVFDNGRKDPEGIRELYVPNPQFSDPVFDDSVEQLIADVNRNGDAILPRMEYREALADGMAYLTQIIPLMNDKKCQACHEPPQKGDPRYERFGDRWKMRSAVKISTSMEPILAEIERNVFASVGVGLFTIFAVAVVLRIFMKIVVVKPLTIIGGTVRQVGEGNLAVSADVSSRDEIGILARQINAMIQGLRERLHLTKFVSSETVEAVKGADLTGVSLGGERRQATVLFSDIRGFTAYSEKVEPEKVIEMLNTFLNEQAQIVRQYRGDIDKFVGDELMAVFQGEKMVEDAVTCAVAIQRKVARLNRNYPQSIGVGIGINAGPMVMGAVGSEDRMDYTVLGDNVNLGARLCGVAGAGQILVSNRAVDLLGKDHSFHLEDREPISVKGKEKPIEVYEVPYTL